MHQIGIRCTHRDAYSVETCISNGTFYSISSNRIINCQCQHSAQYTSVIRLEFHFFPQRRMRTFSLSNFQTFFWGAEYACIVNVETMGPCLICAFPYIHWDTEIAAPSQSDNMILDNWYYLRLSIPKKARQSVYTSLNKLKFEQLTRCYYTEDRYAVSLWQYVCVLCTVLFSWVLMNVRSAR